MWPGAGRTITLRTTNQLVRERYPGVAVIKAGFTFRAGRCLVALVDRDQRRRVAFVLLESADPATDVRRLADVAESEGELPTA